MSTYEATRRFELDLHRLTREQKDAFRGAVEKFVEDLERGQGFRKSLRVQGAEGIFEMTWAPNGRATFQYGPPIRPGERHVIWRRCGTHDVFRAP